MIDIANFLKTTPTNAQWNKIGVKHHHGINLPLFAVHSKNSAGIGEFPDLIPLLTWCKEQELDVLQLLPLNDTGLETSPYGALSAFALNPLHLGLAELLRTRQNPLLAKMLQNAQIYSQRIDYPKLHTVRKNFLHEYFQAYGQEILESLEYKKFVEDNAWVTGYALFKSIKESSQWQSWEKWPEKFKTPSRETIEHLCEKHEVDVSYHQLIQFLCFQQLKAVKEHANQLGVFLKGDIPILINRESADVWLHRELFSMDYSAGAPPDNYSDEGQDWGFPLYNWNAMAKDDYRWWKERLNFASNFYHLYRLDHVVGFYRIWAVAKGEKAKEGRFIPEDRASWIEHGDKILRMIIESSPMLPIGEDLGTIPKEVRQNLKQLGICGTKVMRWERDWEGDMHFIHPDDYPPLSMTTVSTHDSTPLPLWWVESSGESREYALERGWEYLTPLEEHQHFAYLYDSHHTASLFHINLLNEYLALFPELVWPEPEDERINIPGTVSDLNWTYRFKPSIEEIIEHQPLANLVKDLKV